MPLPFLGGSKPAPATPAKPTTSRLAAADHECLGYPIDVYLGAASVDVGSVVAPLIVGGYALHFGRGNPLNAVGTLTPSDALYSSASSPSLGRIQRRSELLGAVEALLALRDSYGERGARSACAHVHTDSKYLAKVWAEWIPEWEEGGWPGEGEETEEIEEPASPRPNRASLQPGGSVRGSRAPSVLSAHGSVRSRTYSRTNGGGGRSLDAQSVFSDTSISSSAPQFFAPSGKPHDEDLMRQLAKLRAHFGMLEASECGGCFFYSCTRRASPAFENAKAAASARGEQALEEELRTRRTQSRNHSRAPSRASMRSENRASGTRANNLPPLMGAMDGASTPAEEEEEEEYEEAPAPPAVAPSTSSSAVGGGGRISRRIYNANGASDAASKRLSLYQNGAASSKRTSIAPSAAAAAAAPAPAAERRRSVRVVEAQPSKRDSQRHMPAMASDAYRRDTNIPKEKKMRWWERAGNWMAA